MSIRFGACIGTDAERMAALASAGYDYAESAINAIAAMTDDEFENFASKVKTLDIKVEACNGFFSGEIKLVGADVDLDVISAYTEKALKRIASLGVEIAVLGSGKSRTVPEGFDRKTAEQQFVKMLRLCGDIAAKYDITIVIEPLRTEECNFINTVAEGLEMCKKANHPNVKCLADFYHVFMNGENLDAVINSGGQLKHTHIARSNADRVVPHCEDDMPACIEWAKALKACNYNGRMSLEGGYNDQFEDMIKKAKRYMDIFNG